MEKRTQMQELWQGALSGKLSRREVMTRGAALGLSGAVLAGLAQESIRGTLAQEGDASATFYSWMTDLHPDLITVGEESGVAVEVAPTEGFGFDRFVAEAQDETSTWDMYGGVTPFLEMISLVESGTIEPWDPYLPEGVLEDFAPATRAEGTYNDQLYVWPWLLDICVQGWNAEIVANAGLDPEVAPKNWDEYIANAQTVVDSGAAPFGCTFDAHDWRSLIPVTHSISTDVYSPDGLFLYTSDAAVEALEILKRMMPLANPDVLNPGTTDGGVNNTPDEQAFAAQQVAYYFKYQNAHFRFAAAWPDPSQVRISALPVAEGGVGGTVFWTTGAVLFTYGENKEASAEFMSNLSRDMRIWQNSVMGNADTGAIPVGQLPVLQSVQNEFETNPPEWVEANPWIFDVYGSLENASAIAPSVLSVAQFNIAQPEWHKYLTGEVADARAALQMADDAVRAEFERQTGVAPQ